MIYNSWTGECNVENNGEKWGLWSDIVGKVGYWEQDKCNVSSVWTIALYPNIKTVNTLQELQ